MNEMLLMAAHKRLREGDIKYIDKDSWNFRDKGEETKRTYVRCLKPSDT
jgi:hypothetical protein